MLTWLTDTIDPRPLGLARIVVGVAAIIRGIVSWPVLTQLAEDHTLRVPYLDWTPEPTLAMSMGIVAVWLVAAILFTLGYRVGITGSFLLAAIVLTLSLDQQTYSNHLYLMAWLVGLMTLADSGAGMNVYRTNRPIVRWPVLLLMIQVSIVYGFSGLTKINTDFVAGRVLAASLRGGLVEFPAALRTPEFLSTLALLVIAVELFLAIFLWRAHLRPAAFLLGLGLHVSITVLMTNTIELLVFSLEMLAIFPLFLEGRLNVEADSRSPWPDRIRRYDLLRVVDVETETSARELTVSHHGITRHGAAAHTRILEHLVPWLWVAPLLRLPGVASWHMRLHRSESIEESTAGA